MIQFVFGDSLIFFFNIYILANIYNVSHLCQKISLFNPFFFTSKMLMKKLFLKKTNPPPLNIKWSQHKKRELQSVSLAMTCSWLSTDFQGDICLNTQAIVMVMW